MPTEGDIKEPSNFVETQNPAYDGGKTGDEGSTSVASDSARSSLTVTSSETRQTCPDCHKALDILPGRSTQHPTDFCRCSKAPTTPPTEADEPSPTEVSLQNVQPAPGDGDGDGDSRQGAASLPSDSGPPPVDEQQPVANREIAAPEPVHAVRFNSSKFFTVQFVAITFLACVVIVVIVLILLLIRDQTTGSGNGNQSVTIRGKHKS